MNKLSMIQKYYILALSESGTLGTIHQEEGKAGLVFAGIYDLLEQGVIKLGNESIRVIKELPSELDYLSSLYRFINKKECSVKKVLNDYLAYAKTRSLINDVCIPLVKEGFVVEKKGGMFNSKTVYIPNKEFKDKLISDIKEEKASQDIALLYLLMKTKNIKRYFTNEEIQLLEKHFSEMSNDEMMRNINYVTNYMVWYTLFFVVFIIFVVWLF